jgi:UDP-N-acetylglucosamine transferase subunit ALG13
LLEAALKAVPPGAEVTWQTGSTPVHGLPIEARPGIPSEQLAAEFAAADVVITHAGVGLSLLALGAGRCPVLVPRLAERGEHVDNHQREVAAELDRRHLAIACEAEDLTLEVLEAAAARSVERAQSPPAFHLVEGRPR